MRNEAVVALLVAAIILAAAGGYYSGVANQKTVTSISTTASTRSILAGTGCTTPVNQPPASSNLTNVYILSVPSESAMCVAYTYEGSGNVSYSAYLTYDMQACQALSSPCSGLNGSVSPSFVSYNGETNVTVTYRISTSAGLAQGVYSLSIEGCEWESLVVGPAPANISKIPVCSPTPNTTYPPAWVVGVTNITVEQVPCALHTAVEGCGGAGRASD
jgi:hypothetical protein